METFRIKAVMYTKTGCDSRWALEVMKLADMCITTTKEHNNGRTCGLIELATPFIPRYLSFNLFHKLSPFGPIRDAKLELDVPGDITTGGTDPAWKLVIEGSEEDMESSGFDSTEFQNGKAVRSGHSLALGGPKHWCSNRTKRKEQNFQHHSESFFNKEIYMDIASRE